MNTLESIASTCGDLGLGPTKVWEYVARGELEACKLGRRTLITRRSIDALIERGIAEAAERWPGLQINQTDPYDKDCHDIASAKDGDPRASDPPHRGVSRDVRSRSSPRENGK